jgi:predicted RNA-binding protein with PIN domain
MYIIDGHNLLHTICKLDELFEPVTDIQMCRIINSFLKLTGQKGELVFDGTGPRDKNAFDNFSNLEVFFSNIGTDADSIIEDKIKADTAPKRLLIVSSDRRLRKAAHARKAASIKSDEFWVFLDKELNKKRPKKEPGGKRQGLSEGETQKWLEIFGIEQ